MSSPHAGHSSGNFSPTRVISLAQAIREVSCERGFWFASPQPPVACSSLACPPVAASRCFPKFPTARCGIEGAPAAAKASPAAWAAEPAALVRAGLKGDLAQFPADHVKDRRSRLERPRWLAVWPVAFCDERLQFIDLRIARSMVLPQALPYC